MPKKKKNESGSDMGLDESLGVIDDETEAPIGKKVVPSSKDAEEDDLLEESADDDEDDLLLVGGDDEEEEEVY